MPDLGSVANSWIVRRPNHAGQQRLSSQTVGGLLPAPNFTATNGSATASGGVVNTSGGFLVPVPDEAIMAPMMAA